ncbi:PLP-dependent aminotransferase family protein [Streptomyces sp. NPDC012403]|uniref:aminotransferase-like domain-containing protein n=1 Tax=Streptomyces sp. NPDC012403 TaxID=3364831 RepID=UPI0036F0192C
MHDYQRIADRIAADILSGRLKPGQRLPPQRSFARRRGIAASTAGRVYAELVRRGLVVGEVGRGTFVRAAPVPSGRALAEPATTAPVNLELNYPTAPDQAALLAPALAPLLRPDVLSEATRTAPADGTPAAREAACGLLATAGWRPSAGQVLFSGNARQAIAGALAALVRPGGRVGIDALTYPLVKEIAARLGVTLVPLAGDADGIRPDSVAAAHRTAPLSALYLQPTLHNPTSATMPETRRRRLAAELRPWGLPVVEDRIWSFLSDDTEPFAAFAPELTYVVDGLSKRVAPGLTVGFLVVPEGRAGRVGEALRSGGWTAGRFALEAALRWMADGTVDRLTTAKRADASRRQRLVTEHLRGFAVRADPRAYYAWWRLPTPWRADTFTAAAAARGIAVTPGPSFAVPAGPSFAVPATGPAPARSPDPTASGAADCVRLGLASAPFEALEQALRTLASLARGTPRETADLPS